MVKTPSFNKNGVIKKAAWSEDEDNKLRTYTSKDTAIGTGVYFPSLSRSGKSCRLRWMNYLRPNIKHGNFTTEEEDIIVQLHNKLGNNGQRNWTKVQRRKNIAAVNIFPEATSYYVAGMSNGATKMDIRRCFGGFGDLVDIFMEKKKDSTGRNFAFVKFANVEDRWKLERDMQNVFCAGKTLTVNLARHITHPSRAATGGNAARSYADVTNGWPARAALQTPITLSACNVHKNWLKSNVLVGEALSIDHMASLPSGIYGDDRVENLRYIGGLNVPLCFKTELRAENFLKDTGRWIEWFHWLVPGDSRDFCDDRIAWINIRGLPMRLWSDDNV